MMSGYERVDWSFDGVKRRGELVDGSPEQFIRSALLMPDNVLAQTAFRRVTHLRSCKGEVDNAERISYVELRSPQMTAAVQAWRAGNNNVTGFRTGALLTDLAVFKATKKSGDGQELWNPRYVFAPAPDWVPKERLNQESFVAFWGRGHLFKGETQDQYYWVGTWPKSPD